MTTTTYTRTLSLSTRRFLVAVRALLFCAMIIIWVAFRAEEWLKLVLVMVANLHISLSFVLYYKNPIWRLANAPNDRLDEREVQVRAQAYIDAFRYLSLITIGIVIVADVAPSLSQQLVATEATSFLVVLFFSLLLTLPSDFLAWREREV